MTKILKKSLACLLAFALCFTAVASCLAVSAAAPAMTSDVSFYTQSRPGDHRDDHANELCVGEKVRAQITLENIQAGSSIGIEVDLPTGLNPSEITYGTFDKGAKFDIVSKNYDEETGKFTMILDVTTTGDYVYFVYFIVGENVPQDRVFSLEYKIEATFASDDAVYKKTSAQPWPMRVFAEHVEETLEAVAPGCETTGLTEGSHCARCLETFKAQEEVEALGHKYDDGVINPDAGCESTGIKTFTCVNGCGTSYTEVIDAKGHTEVAYEDVEATCTSVGYTGGSYCDVCKAEIQPRTEVPMKEHDFSNGDCVCGEKAPSQGVTIDPNLVFQGVSMAFGTSSLEMNFRVRQTVLNLYDKVELVIIPQKYNTSTKNYAVPQEIVIQQSQMGGTSIRTYQYTDMMLYELALDVQYKLRAYTGDVLVAESALASKSAVSYLKNDVLNGTGAGITDDLRTVAVDMLIVCEEARLALATAGSDLERDSKISVLEGVNLSLATPEVNKNHNKVNNFDPSADGWGILDTDKYYVKTSVAMEKVPVLGLRITDNREFDLNKFNIKVSYTSASSAGYQEENLTGAKLTRSGKFITTKFTNVGLHDSNADITLEFSYDGVLKGTLTYSMETFLGSSLEDPTIGKLAGALLNLGESFRTLKGY